MATFVRVSPCFVMTMSTFMSWDVRAMISAEKASFESRIFENWSCTIALSAARTVGSYGVARVASSSPRM